MTIQYCLTCEGDLSAGTKKSIKYNQYQLLGLDAVVFEGDAQKENTLIFEHNLSIKP